MAKPKNLPYEAADTPGPFSVTLHSTAGGSDKIYKLTIEPAGDLFVVNYANGRRGGTLATGTKTNAPVDYAGARRILNDTLYSKVGSGYVPIAGSRFADDMNAEAIATIARESSGHLPQLLNPIANTADELEPYLTSADWVAEEKHDGERRFVIVDAEGIRGGNRTGRTVALPDVVAATARSLEHNFVLDGEQIGDVFHAFDILHLDGDDLRGKTQQARRGVLEWLLKDVAGTAIRLTREARTEAEKRALLDDVRARSGEGVVFKNRDAIYVTGRPGAKGDWVKLKLWNTLSAIVSRVNDKRSVALELIDDASKDRIPVGNVTIPANAELPKAGDVVEVRYLYAYDGGALFQPTFLGVRSDISTDECLAGQRSFVAAEVDGGISPAGPRA